MSPIPSAAFSVVLCAVNYLKARLLLLGFLCLQIQVLLYPKETRRPLNRVWTSFCPRKKLVLLFEEVRP